MRIVGGEHMRPRPDKTQLGIIILAIIGILLIIFGSMAGNSKNDVQVEATDVSFYTAYLEGRVAELCKSVDGITEATVFLTLDCSGEYVYSKDSSSDYIILSGSDGEEAVRLCEIYPRVRGVAVVCTGGELPRIREIVTELLSASLDLPSSKIKVAGS